MGPFIVSVHLAIESSQRCGGVAVRGATGMVRTITLESASGVDDQLMPAIKQLFDEVGAQPQDLSLIGVSIGPGGFTGLRVAVSTARTLAMTTGCRVVAVPSAIVAAMGYSETEGDVATLLAGRRDSVWLTRALLLIVLLEVLSPPASIHSARLLRAAGGAAAVHGRNLIWQYVRLRWLVATAALAHWSFWDVSVASMLRPVRFEPIVVRLYNEMHYRGTETLVAITLLALAVPAGLTATVAIIWKQLPDRDS